MYKLSPAKRDFLSLVARNGYVVAELTGERERFYRYRLRGQLRKMISAQTFDGFLSAGLLQAAGRNHYQPTPELLSLLAWSQR